MPLPDDRSMPWPPLDIEPYTRMQRQWAAWWTGDKKQLQDTAGFDEQAKGRRRFWQRRGVGDDTRAVRDMHVALAADIATTSADLIFGEPPDLTIPGMADESTSEPNGNVLSRSEAFAAQHRMEELADAIGLPNKLLEAAESAAAIGGAWLRPVWDRDIADHPLLTVIDDDRAVPDYRLGMLQAVTFHEVVLQEQRSPWEHDYEVWRHLERHEPGVILHGLYVGTSIELGRRVALDAHPSTAGFDDEITDHAAIPGLLIRYVPNALPNRRRRELPIGQSDFAGSEDELDSLDETWSSWMRDLRLGQARLIVPREFLSEAGSGRRGDGKTLDLDTELFTGLEMADLAEITDPIREVQFAIRVEDHERTVLRLVEQIVSRAGYSPQTFGLKIEGRAESGTALRIREAKTIRTVSRKRRYWFPGVTQIAENLLALDSVVFGRSTPVARPELRWPSVADDPEATARWLGLLRTAQAVSRATAVRLAQPNLDEAAAAEEVKRVEEEFAPALPDIEQFGRGGGGEPDDE